MTIFLSGWLPALAADLENVASGATADLNQALCDLAAARQGIEAERLPLARQLRDLEQKLAARKADLAKAQRSQENHLVELNALKAEAKRREEQVKYLESLLNEYARAFRSRLAFVEEPRYLAMLEAVDQAGAEPDVSPAQRFTRRSVLLTTALKRAEEALGGDRFEATAVDAQGTVQPGQVALIGPVAVFAASSGVAAGLLQQELNRAAPSVAVLAPNFVEASRALARTGAGQLPLDPTLGNAFKLMALHESLQEKLAKGGLMMIPLLALGLAAVLVAGWKWVQLSRVRPVTEFDLQRVMQHLQTRDSARALALARAVTGPVGALLATAVEHAGANKEYIEELLYEKMLASRARLERGIAFLALAATTGPLMGLLGTVMGMIATFKLISSFGSGDPKMLAAGISEALICTATGMAVAIPALLSHAFLSRKAKGVIHQMEQIAVGFLNGHPT